MKVSPLSALTPAIASAASVEGPSAPAAGPQPAAKASTAADATPPAAGSVAAPAGQVREGAAAAGKAESTAGLKQIADEFERLLLLQMLRTSKVCGDEKGYGSMMVDSLADGVMRGGGLGLSDTIVRSLERTLSSSRHVGESAKNSPDEKKDPSGLKP